jgi:hypothetical protein
MSRTGAAFLGAEAVFLGAGAVFLGAGAVFLGATFFTVRFDEVVEKNIFIIIYNIHTKKYNVKL